MATTSKTLAPTNQTITIPDMTERPNASVLTDAIGKEADAINALNSNIQLKYDTSVGGISAFRVLDNITIWLGSGLTISTDGKTANQLIPSGYRPNFNAQFFTKVYNGSEYVDCVVTFNTDGKIIFATLFNSAIAGIQTNYLATKTFSYMRNPNA